MTQMLKYVLQDVIRARFVLFYWLFIVAVTTLLFQLDSDPAKVVVSLLNVILLVVPLVCIVFTTIHFFNSYEFILLLMAQPIARKTVFLSQYIGVASSLALAFLAGVGLPAIAFGGAAKVLSILGIGLFITFTFVSLGFLAASLSRDKAKAIGIALLFWIYFALIYDGLILWVVYAFNDYPLEIPTLILTSLNPLDLGRIVMLLSIDVSALMGYTGAFFKEFFGNLTGEIFSLAMLSVWVLWPLWVALHRFKHNDL
ncbi:MAG: ABC transporter permease subunit [Bacteroidetes bacterium]|nr:ABC transporter permease subunit [Bacteroidota bacterium]MBS1539611.1 ABC transporter permease subunit [Bacteroidota bacterium]